jgi:hypothetical protein
MLSIAPNKQKDNEVRGDYSNTVAD